MNPPFIHLTPYSQRSTDCIPTLQILNQICLKLQYVRVHFVKISGEGLPKIKQPYSFWYNSNTGLCKLCAAVVMYRFHCNDLPGHFQNYFTLNSSIHEHLTRSQNKLHILYARTVTLSCQLRIAGPKLWNNIDPTIKITSLHLRKFKQVFKNHLLSFYI